MNTWSLGKSYKTVPAQLKVIRFNFIDNKNLNGKSNICTFYGVKFAS